MFYYLHNTIGWSYLHKTPTVELDISCYDADACSKCQHFLIIAILLHTVGIVFFNITRIELLGTYSLQQQGLQITFSTILLHGLCVSLFMFRNSENVI